MDWMRWNERTKHFKSHFQMKLVRKKRETEREREREKRERGKMSLEHFRFFASEIFCRKSNFGAAISISLLLPFAKVSCWAFFFSFVFGKEDRQASNQAKEIIVRLPSHPIHGCTRISFPDAFTSFTISTLFISLPLKHIFLSLSFSL